MKHVKVVEELTPDDFMKSPIWEFTDSHEDISETIVEPINKMPVRSMTRRVIGTRVGLAGGAERWALIGNLDLSNPRLTQHFLTLSVYDRKRWFPMARYHDIDSDEHGPKALAKFLKLPIAAVFPITYDISAYCIGSIAVVKGIISEQPNERLTRAEIIALAVPKRGGSN